MLDGHASLRNDKKAASPAFSSVIITAAVIVMVLTAMSLSNSLLGKNVHENEFGTNQQFMHTTAVQIDDIAWIVGRTQTVSYLSKVGQIGFEPSALNYTVEVHKSSGWETLMTYQTGIILFNTPVESFSMGNDYFIRVPNSANGSFLQSGSSAPISQVFCVEKLPMSDGSYLRIAVVPTVRVLDSSNYFKFYLPSLENGTNLYRSQSVTMSGTGISKVTAGGIDQVRITADFPKAALGFDSSFYNFDHLTETKSLPSGSVVEFYSGDVLVTIGQV